MASLIPKLNKNTTTLRIIITTFIPKPTPSLISHQTHISTTNPAPVLGPTNGAKVEVEPTQSMMFFPSFPFGYSLNPVSSTGFEPFVVDEDARTVWADSVKKKRKRKMNKHKYRKLRKRLRRKTKA